MNKDWVDKFNEEQKLDLDQLDEELVTVFNKIDSREELKDFLFGLADYLGYGEYLDYITFGAGLMKGKAGRDYISLNPDFYLPIAGEIIREKGKGKKRAWVVYPKRTVKTEEGWRTLHTTKELGKKTKKDIQYYKRSHVHDLIWTFLHEIGHLTGYGEVYSDRLRKRLSPRAAEYVLNWLEKQ